MIKETFLELLNEVNYEKNKSEILVLDLGCDYFISNLELLIKQKRNKNINFKYTIVDIQSENDIFCKGMLVPQDMTEPINSSEWVQKINESCFHERSNEKIDLPEFNNCVSLNFNMNALDYCTSNKTSNRFDLIILSNILHFVPFNEANVLFDCCYEMLKENGLMYIRVLNDSDHGYDGVNFYKQNEIDKMKNKFNYIVKVDSSPINFTLIGRK